MKWLLNPILYIVFFHGCMSSSNVNLSIASSKEKPKTLTILKRGVTGEHCKGFMGFYGSYSVAINNALNKVDSANVLVNAKFSRKELPISRICVMVEGDAARL